MSHAISSNIFTGVLHNDKDILHFTYQEIEMSLLLANELLLPL